MRAVDGMLRDVEGMLRDVDGMMRDVDGMVRAVDGMFLRDVEEGMLRDTWGLDTTGMLM